MRWRVREQGAITMAADFPEIDRATITTMARRSTGRPRLSVTEWRIDVLQGGGGRSPGVGRIVGAGRDGDTEVRWSVVLKLLGRSTGGESTNLWNYWRREADAYESGFLRQLPGGLVAPRCLAVREVEPGLVALWLDDIIEPAGDWTIADYGVAATTLGRFAGAYLSGRPAPNVAWLSRHWLRDYVEYNAPTIELIRHSLGHPLVRRTFPPDVLTALMTTWDERSWYLDQLDRLPRTLCHMDAFRRNLFRTGDLGGESTMAIDWAFTGHGAVGEDLAPLVVASLALGGPGTEVAAGLERAAIEGYLSGLASSGVDVDERLVRHGYALAATLRYSIGPLETIVRVLLDESRHDRFAQFAGASVDEVCDTIATMHREMLMPLALEGRLLAKHPALPRVTRERRLAGTVA
jgi:hypothetical protein